MIAIIVKHLPRERKGVYDELLDTPVKALYDTGNTEVGVLGVLDKTALADALDVWMKRQRLQPAALARLAGVSRPTVYAALRGDRISGDSLRAIARGLATDPFSGELDPAVYAEALRELAEVGSHPDLAVDVPMPDLEALIRAEGVKSPAKARALAEFIRKYPSMTPDQRRLVDALIDHADDSMSVHLASSHDGQVWSWLSTAPILTKGPPGAWDSGYVFAHVELTELPDGSWVLPYSGFDIPHKAPRFDSIVRTGYARWPHGRLMAVEAQGDGEFSTAAFYPPSEQLRVNVRTASGGSVRIEPRTRTGAPIPGRSFEDATPIAGDQPAASVRWGVNEDLGREPGQAVYLRFRLSRAELFGIEFV